MARGNQPKISGALVDQLLADADPKTVFDPNGLLDDLKKAFAERALNAKMDHPLDGEDESGNKTVMTDSGAFELAVPRDRKSSFDPQLIGKYQRRFPGFNDTMRHECRHLHVCPWHEPAFVPHRRTSAGIVRHRRFTGSDRHGDRRRSRGGRRLAGPASGGRPSPGLLRRICFALANFSAYGSLPDFVLTIARCS